LRMKRREATARMDLKRKKNAMVPGGHRGNETCVETIDKKNAQEKSCRRVMQERGSVVLSQQGTSNAMTSRENIRVAGAQAIRKSAGVLEGVNHRSVVYKMGGGNWSGEREGKLLEMSQTRTTGPDHGEIG